MCFPVLLFALSCRAICSQKAFQAGPKSSILILSCFSSLLKRREKLSITFPVGPGEAADPSGPCLKCLLSPLTAQEEGLGSVHKPAQTSLRHHRPLSASVSRRTIYHPLSVLQVRDTPSRTPHTLQAEGPTSTVRPWRAPVFPHHHRTKGLHVSESGQARRRAHSCDFSTCCDFSPFAH